MASPVGCDGRILPMINAHLDTHAGYTDGSDKERLISVAKELKLDENNEWVIRPDEEIQIGSDCRVGLALCLYVANHMNYPVKLLFTVQEEIGRLGVAYSLEHSKPFFENTSFALVLDRHSSEGNDIIHSYHGRIMAPVAMLNNIERISASLMYPMIRRASPRCADAYSLSLAGIKTVYLSCEIWSEHSKCDRVNIQEAVNTLQVVRNCIEMNENLLKSGTTDEHVTSRMCAEV